MNRKSVKSITLNIIIVILALISLYLPYKFWLYNLDEPNYQLLENKPLKQ
jgi:hypothetical protein